MPAVGLILPITIAICIATMVALSAWNKLTLVTAILSTLPVLVAVIFLFIMLHENRKDD